MPICQLATAASEEEYVYGACEPGWDHNASTIEGWIQFMQDNNIERVCCLLSSRQVAAHDKLIGQYQDAFGTESVLHAPVTDHTLIPESMFTNEIIPFLEKSAAADEKVVVHCKAGIGRTGQALAGWLVHAHDYSPNDAIETVSNRHRTPDDAVRAGHATTSDLIDRLGSLATKNG